MTRHFNDPNGVLLNLFFAVLEGLETAGTGMEDFLIRTLPVFKDSLGCNGAYVFRSTGNGVEYLQGLGPDNQLEFLLTHESQIQMRSVLDSGKPVLDHVLENGTACCLFQLERFGLLALTATSALDEAIILRLRPVMRLFALSCQYHLNALSVPAKSMENENLAEQMYQAKVKFMSNIGHEIYTPLNVIIGMLRLLRETQLDDHQLRLLSNITTASDNLLTQVNDILDFRVIDSGKMELQMGVFNIHEMFRRLFDANEYKADNKCIIIKYHTDPSIPRTLIGDSLRLMQILNNLLSNAIKFTKTGSIDFYCQLIEGTGDKFKILFCVEDTGIGISAENLEKIFESFQQEDDSYSKTYGGIGLGLTISKKLVNLMGGNLEARSARNVGSRFFFTIELEMDQPDQLTDEKPSVMRENPSLPGIKVLLVEDNEFNQYFTLAILESWGAVCTIAEDGQKAIDLVRKEKFDLILMDIQMPVMDGFTSATYMRQNLKMTTPILALTASVVKGIQEPFIKAGMQGCITKPFEVYDLYCKIKAVLPISGEKPEEATDELENRMLMDLSSLTKMVGNDPVKLRRMVEKFLEVTPADVDDLAMHAKNRNLEAISRTSHKLKSSIRLVSVESMSDLIRTINENSARGQGDDLLYAMIKKFLKHFPTLMQQLKELS